MNEETRSILINRAQEAARGIGSLEEITSLLIQVKQQYQNGAPIISAVVNSTATPVDNLIHQILGLTLPAVADSAKEINGIVNQAKLAATPEEKARYHVQAEGRIEEATIGLRQFLWTLFYKAQQ